MNRLRLTVLSGLLVFAGLSLGASQAMAQIPSGAAPAPRYYYGPGYSGYGYYYYPTAPTVPTYRGGYYSAPAPSYSRGTSTSRYPYDPTGRHDNLARPWLRPLR
jgi:hypothetical protein